MVDVHASSHTSIAQHIDVVALREFRTGVVILDRTLNVVFADACATHLMGRSETRELALTETIRQLVITCFDDPTFGGSTSVVDGLWTRIVPLDGTENGHVALLLEQLYTRETLERAAARFKLSRREGDVVRLLLDGDSIAEIAGRLAIAESTVGDYVKRLFAKTRVRNRTEMIAKVLGWRPAERSS
jgi:DNA-binding CsgD family transcriptional regulator